MNRFSLDLFLDDGFFQVTVSGNWRTLSMESVLKDFNLMYFITRITSLILTDVKGKNTNLCLGSI